MNQQDKESLVDPTTKFQAELENSENFGDIFEIVKKSVKRYLRKERSGLMLVLTDLPIQLGGFHGIGGNSIVMNRTLLDRIVAARHPRSHVKSFVYSILLHEYLHSLGYIREEDVRRLVYEISNKAFGPTHPATTIALKSPWSLLPKTGFMEPQFPSDAALDSKPKRTEIVKDFDRSDKNYIS